MNKNETIPVIVVNAILVLYLFLIAAGSSSFLIELIFLLSPVLVIWMVYSVLKKGVYTGRELEKDEEYGYSDQVKNN